MFDYSEGRRKAPGVNIFKRSRYYLYQSLVSEFRRSLFAYYRKNIFNWGYFEIDVRL